MEILNKKNYLGNRGIITKIGLVNTRVDFSFQGRLISIQTDSRGKNREEVYLKILLVESLRFKGRVVLRIDEKVFVSVEKIYLLFLLYVRDFVNLNLHKDLKHRVLDTEVRI